MLLPPGPIRSPLANLRRFVRDPYAVFWDAAAEYGPVFGVRVAGWPPWVSVGEPELIELIFRARAEQIAAPSETSLPPGCVAPFDGGPRSLPGLRGARAFDHARCSRSAVDALLERARPGQRVVLTELLGSIGTRALVDCVFGVADAVRRDRLVAAIEADALRRRGPVRQLATTLLRAEPVHALIEGKAALGRLRLARDERSSQALIADEIARYRGAPRDRDDVLARVLAAGDQGEAPSDDELPDQLLALVLDGRASVAIGLAWALYFLLTHRYAREHVLDELARDRQGAWTRAVIDETLRIRPLAHHCARRLDAELQLGAWTLPAGTQVFAAQATAHFRADLWTNPHEFRPERFLAGERSPSPFVYFPFGGATAGCLGRSLVLGQLQSILARLLERVDLRLAVEANPRPALLGRLVGPSDGVPAFIERIRPASVD